MRYYMITTELGNVFDDIYKHEKVFCDQNSIIKMLVRTAKPACIKEIFPLTDVTRTEDGFFTAKEFGSTGAKSIGDIDVWDKFKQLGIFNHIDKQDELVRFAVSTDNDELLRYMLNENEPVVSDEILDLILQEKAVNCLMTIAKM